MGREPHPLEKFLFKKENDSGLQCFDTVGWAAGRASGL